MLAKSEKIVEEYKMSRLGYIPIDWEIKQLSEVLSINPENLSRSTPSDLSIKYIDIESVTNGEITKYKDYIFSEAPSRARRKVRKNDVLLSTVRPYLKAFTIIKDDKENLICSTGFAVLRSSNEVESDYVYHYIFSDIYLNQLLSQMRGSNYPAVNSKDVEESLIILPSIPEQQKIVDIFSTVDKKIKNNDQLISKTKELKKGLMQQLLTKGIGHKEFKTTDIGEIPIVWETKKFIEITDVLKCGVASTPEYVENGVPFLSSQNVKENKLILDKYNFISKEYHEELTKKYKPAKGDILYTRVGANFGKSTIVDVDWEFSVYVSLTLIRMKENYDSLFYSYLLNSEKYQRLAKSKVFQGGGVPNLNVGEVEKFDMVVPPLQEQRKIAQILSSVDEKIKNYELEKEKYIELKKGLMQQLLTGKLRVTV
ncbi:restriction endonuclease subunit S [Priestia megaterium]|uniref:restriction endonuclease subunit S n=1 Tax=Priestia megaterium TaxID=1404 RepID=UPI001C8E74FD|nr:restriction endonuclease subunit S [Priestia megaterium]MBY0201403.1 restriction endonuclease subunit S [Priestia megaterium]